MSTDSLQHQASQCTHPDTRNRASARHRRSVFRDHAPDLARMGFRVIRVRPGTKIPFDPEWPKRATNDPAAVAALARLGGARCNVGIATGVGLVVIDVDPRNGGSPDPSWPKTLTVRTASDGWHFYYEVHPSHAIRSRPCPALGPGVDVKADGGFVVAPGSVLLERGEVRGEWAWVDSTVSRAALTDDMFAAVQSEHSQAPQSAVNGSYGPRFDWPEEPHTIREGGRRDFLLSAAGSLANAIAAVDMEDALREADAVHCWPSWAEDEPRSFEALVRAAEGWCHR